MKAVNPSAVDDSKSSPQSSSSSEFHCNHTPKKKRTEFKKRVNHYLYDNLNRVLCELYFYCEHESNAIQCTEVLRILSEASLQFHQLNRQLILLSKANMTNTRSISWNVSSLSPQKLDFCKFRSKSNKLETKENRFRVKKSEESPPKSTCVNNADEDDDKTDCDEESKPQPSEISTPESPLLQQTKAADTTPTTPKPKKVIKCWADIDSESDVELESVNDDDRQQNEYEKYIKYDLQQMRSTQDDEKEIEVMQVESKVTKTAKATDDEKEAVVESQQNEERNPLNEIYQNKPQTWRIKKDPLKESVIETQTKGKLNLINLLSNDNRIETKKNEILTPKNNENENVNLTNFTSNDNQFETNNKEKELDVWFSSHETAITLNDIMNDQSQKSVHKTETKENGKSPGSTRNGHNFAVPFNQMVANHRKPRQFLYITSPTYPKFRDNKKIDKLVNKLSNSKQHYHNISRGERLKKSQLKQQKAEKRRLQLREQRTNKWQVVAAKKKQKREELRKQTERKMLQQKQELNKKLSSAKMRYENTMKEKKLKAKQYDIKIKNAKKIKDNELSQKREIQRKSQEERMKNAQNRYKKTISKKKQSAKCKQLKNTFKTLKETEKDKEKDSSSKKRKNNKNRQKNRYRNSHKVPQMKSSFKEEGEEIIDEEGMKEILTVLLHSSQEYIDGIKPKKEWTKNCHYSELKACVQSLCNKINRLITNSTFASTKYENSLSFLMSITKKNEDINDRDNGLESGLQNTLKLMDNKQTEDASTTYLLMYLMDHVIGLIPYFSYLSVRTQRLLLQCIANSTQKNRGVSHYIIRSKSCLFLAYLLMKMLSEQSSSEIDSIVHALTLSLNSIRDFPDLVDRKLFFYKYLSVLGFFNRIVSLFGRIKIKNKSYDLLLRIIPFMQSVTSFNKQSLARDPLAEPMIYDVVYDTNCYGLHSLISSLVLLDNHPNSWRKKRSNHILRIILYSFQTINNIARMNIESFQCIIEQMRLTELYHVVSHLLQHLTFYYKNANHSNNNQMHNYVIRILLAQIVLFIGYCSLKNKRFQRCLRWGEHQNTLIHKLSQLPFDYFSKPADVEVLFPTLIAATFDNEANCKILNTVFNNKHLTRFILQVYHKQHNKSGNEKDSKKLNSAYSLGKRFPIKLWPDAIRFYRR